MNSSFCWTQYMGECLQLAEFLRVIIRPVCEQIAIILYITVMLYYILNIDDAEEKI